MDKQWGQMMYKDLPEDLLLDASRQVQNFSTAIIHLVKDIHGYKLDRVGSGTFVKIDDVYGVLTAFHVTAIFTGADRIGLFARPEGEEHHFSLGLDECHILNIARPESEPIGPDLSFIRIPANKVAVLRQYKTFYNLDPDRVSVKNLSSNFQRGLWALCGVPAELSHVVDPEIKQFDNMRVFSLFVGYAGVSQIERFGEHDLVHTTVEHPKEINNSDIPTNYSGISGGGLWRIQLRNEGDELSPDKYYLAGVNFYQENPLLDERIIRGNGPRSIYKQAAPSIVSQYKR